MRHTWGRDAAANVNEGRGGRTGWEGDGSRPLKKPNGHRDIKRKKENFPEKDGTTAAASPEKKVEKTWGY